MKALCRTKDMNHEEWLDQRKKGIGGSDAAAVAGLNRWKSAVEVWLDKTGQGEPKEQNEKMYWGVVLEDVIAQEFEKRSGKKVKRYNSILQHPEHEFMLANVDRLIIGERAGLECKTSSKFFSDQWTETVYPQEYYLQCQHYMAVTGLSKWYLAVLLNGSEYREYEIDRDEEVIESLIKIESDFWKLVQDGIPPEPDGSKASTEIIKKMYPEAKNTEEILLPNEAEELIKQYNQASELEDIASKQKDEASNKLKAMLKDSETGRCSGAVVRWKNIISHRLDNKRLKKEQPDIYEDYTEESLSRKFSIKIEEAV